VSSRFLSSRSYSRLSRASYSSKHFLPPTDVNVAHSPFRDINDSIDPQEYRNHVNSIYPQKDDTAIKILHL
jgi:hypothetical protein